MISLLQLNLSLIIYNGTVNGVNVLLLALKELMRTLIRLQSRCKLLKISLVKLKR